MDKVIRPTQVVRNLMRAHGAPQDLIWTNTYDKCRTVKCYVINIDVEAFKRELLEVYTELEFGCPQVYCRPAGSIHRPFDSLIVRIPRSLQA